MGQDLELLGRILIFIPNQKHPCEGDDQQVPHVLFFWLCIRIQGLDSQFR